MPADAAAIREAGDPIMKYEAATAHELLYEKFGAQYRPSIKTLVEAGRAITRDEYAAARKAMSLLRDGMIETLSGFDALLLPVAPATAPASLETTGNGIFCAPASFAGLPAVSLPSGIAARRPAARRPAHGRPSRRVHASSAPPPGSNQSPRLHRDS